MNALTANAAAASFLRSYFGPVDQGDTQDRDCWSHGEAFDVYQQLAPAISKASPSLDGGQGR
jgi:hypothetical protein